MANLAAKCQSLEFLFFLLYRIEPYITETLFTLHRETKKSMVYRYLLYFIRVLLNLPLFSLGRYYLKVNFKKEGCISPNTASLLVLTKCYNRRKRTRKCNNK